MGYGNIVMFAFREFFVEVIGKSLVPYTDIDSSIIQSINGERKRERPFTKLNIPKTVGC